MESYLTDHFTWAEATVTQITGVSNLPDPEQRVNIRRAAVKLEMVRAILGHKSLTVNSWFRSKEVNSAVGGSATSSHMSGEAVDFTCTKFGTALQICEELVKWADFLQIDQLILYKGRVHIGFRKTARKQFLTKAKDGTYPVGFHPEKL